jgi:hypothetical protein
MANEAGDRGSPLQFRPPRSANPLDCRSGQRSPDLFLPGLYRDGTDAAMNFARSPCIWADAFESI